VLLFGVVGGAVAGGAIGYTLADDGSSPTATSSAERTSANVDPTATGEDANDDTRIVQPGDPTATEQDEEDASQAEDGAQAESDPADIVEQVSPAVVTVINQQVFQGGLTGQSGTLPVGTGTGFIISEEGYIVTNNHVVEGSDSLQVIFADGTAVDGALLGTDATTDLAVIKVDVEVPGVVPLGDSDALRPGEEVIAIGSALGEYTNTVTAGVISGLGRQLDCGIIDNLIQHDAPINPGNSGGPLLNMQGEVVGVNTAVIRNAGSGITAEGLGFAVPSNTVDTIVTQIIEDGRVVRPFLGVNFQIVTPSLAATEGWPVDYGAAIQEIPSNGPVAATGIQVDDIITKLNGEALTQVRSLQTILFQYAPGDVISVEVYRPDTGETLTFDVTLGERPADLG
jgi:2-alkenal reductase